ncbi:MAG: NAD(P)H-hydrate dehydratase [Eubacteriales bacterium]|nr:NAD(P)H-hydrate dehydratase [Eubacteriales bacterium]
MKKIVTCEQMKYLDQQTFDRFHLPSIVLMERASLRVFEFVKDKYRNRSKEKILVVCGSGNNGGDGIAVARLLYLAGYQVSCFLAGTIEKMTEQTMIQYRCASEYGVPFVDHMESKAYTIVIDAVFGVGLSRCISGKYHSILKEMNEMSALKIAVDIPSGINGDTGEIMGIAFKADYTITFAFQKQGLCMYPAKMYAGEIIVSDIGIYDCEDRIHKYQLESTDLANIPKRMEFGNKGTFGKILILAGSEGMSGAAYLCALAAFHAGAGMVLVHTAESNRIILQTLLPEAMISCDFSENEYRRLYNWCDCIVIGPGLGMKQAAQDHMDSYLTLNKNEQKPMIIDADGLNLLAMKPDWQKELHKNVIVTPHVGEMAKLTGKSIPEIKNSFIQSAADYSVKHHLTCVLKDAVTVISGRTINKQDESEQNVIYLNTETNPGLATAGSGDVLSGTIAGVIGCFLSEYHGLDEKSDYDGSEYKIQRRSMEELNHLLTKAAAYGVLLHSVGGKAAVQKCGQRSMKARDILEGICECLKNEEMK